MLLGTRQQAYTEMDEDGLIIKSIRVWCKRVLTSNLLRFRLHCGLTSSKCIKDLSASHLSNCPVILTVFYKVRFAVLLPTHLVPMVCVAVVYFHRFDLR